MGTQAADTRIMTLHALLFLEVRLNRRPRVGDSPGPVLLQPSLSLLTSLLTLLCPSLQPHWPPTCCSSNTPSNPPSMAFASALPSLCKVLSQIPLGLVYPSLPPDLWSNIAFIREVLSDHS